MIRHVPPPAEPRKPLLESEAAPRARAARAAAPAGRVAAGETLRVVVLLRSRPLPSDHPLAHEAHPDRMPHERRRLEPHEVAELQRPADADVAAVVAFAQAAGLRVVESSAVRHDVVLEGTVSAVEAAFGLELLRFPTPAHGHRRGHHGPVHLPEALHPVVESVLGLDDLPLGRPRVPARVPRKDGLLWPREAAEAYRFPAGAGGAGRRIAIVSFGGGFHVSDLRAYFERTVAGHAPRVRVVAVGGAKNTPLATRVLRRFVRDFEAGTEGTVLAERYGADLDRALGTFETTMDVEIAGALAPRAEIDVYLAENTPAAWYAAIHAALGEAGGLDPGAPAAHRRPDVLSISWGNPESHWKANRMWPIHRALELARHHGVTVCCASGDFGSLGAPPEPGEALLAGVSFPASSPATLAVGGTRLDRAGGGRHPVDIAWNATWGGVHMASGGGVSGLFALPAWQQEEAAVPDPRDLAPGVWLSQQVHPQGFRGRGLPDVAACADGATGYRIRVGGVETVGGGTSAATPLWAALVALLCEELGHPLGWLNPVVYRPGLRGGFRDVTRGDNDVGGGVPSFRAGPGWDAVSGLGAPDGEALLAALRPGGGAPPAHPRTRGGRAA